MKSIAGYARGKAPKIAAICDQLRAAIDGGIPEAKVKIWHGAPLWFLGANPVVGYDVRTDRVELLLWSGQLFDEPQLKPMGKDKAAKLSFTDRVEINISELDRWLEKARTIVFDCTGMYAQKRANQTL